MQRQKAVDMWTQRRKWGTGKTEKEQWHISTTTCETDTEREAAIQHRELTSTPVMTWRGGRGARERRHACIHTADSLCCPAETIGNIAKQWWYNNNKKQLAWKTKTHCLMILEARSLKSRSKQGWFLMRSVRRTCPGTSPSSQWCVAHLQCCSACRSSTLISAFKFTCILPVYTFASKSPFFYKEASHTALRAHPIPL